MANTYSLIAVNTVTNNTTTFVTFSSIPQTYTDLLLKSSARSDNASTASNINITFNNEAPGSGQTTYSSILFRGNGASATTGTNSNLASVILYQYANGATTTANTFAIGDLYIPSYTVAQNKQFGSFSAQENNTTGAFLNAPANLWRNTNPISAITLTVQSVNFIAGSSFYLYGIKNS